MVKNGQRLRLKGSTRILATWMLTGALLAPMTGCQTSPKGSGQVTNLTPPHLRDVIIEPIFCPNRELIGVTITNNMTTPFALSTFYYSVVFSDSKKTIYPFHFEDLDLEQQVIIAYPRSPRIIPISFDTDVHDISVSEDRSFIFMYSDLKPELEEFSERDAFSKRMLDQVKSGELATGLISFRYEAD